MDKKKEQLRDALGRLSLTQATRLAHALELQRSLGTETLPTETVLEGVRPRLRDARPGRAPSICRLVCSGFEEFLSDHDDEPRVEGLIPRRSIKPWWTAARHVAADQIAALTAQLRMLLARHPSTSLDVFRDEVQHAAGGWAATIVAGLDKPKRDPQLVRLLSGPLADDARAIAQILPLAPCINATMTALTALLDFLQRVDHGRITDLVPEGVSLLKEQYLALSESHGTDARYLALAVTNRLKQPCQILRLAHALTWKTTDTLVANSEFACIGGRLIGDLQRLSRMIVTSATRRKTLPPPEELSQPIAAYMEQAEALLKEIDLRRESAWGEAILRTRAKLAEVLDHGLLELYAQLVLAAMPQPAGKRDLSATSYGDVEIAFEATQLIALLAHRGQRHGFAQAARDTLNALGPELERRADEALRLLQKEPHRAEALQPQLEAAAKLFDVVIAEGRSHVLLRQIANALRASA
jgi:hypothetical protein